MTTQTQVQNQNIPLDELDLQIEQGEIDPENGFYATAVLNVLNIWRKSKKFQRPRGKNMPVFTQEEALLLGRYLFLKPPTIQLYERTPSKKELPPRRRLFIEHFLGDAHFNRAKAARMAGYSVRSAKQIAYYLMRH